jgi:hypothetical protein
MSWPLQPPPACLCCLCWLLLLLLLLPLLPHLPPALLTTPHRTSLSNPFLRARRSPSAARLLCFFFLFLFLPSFLLPVAIVQLHLPTHSRNPTTAFLTRRSVCLSPFVNSNAIDPPSPICPLKLHARPLRRGQFDLRPSVLIRYVPRPLETRTTVTLRHCNHQCHNLLPKIPVCLFIPLRFLLAASCLSIPTASIHHRTPPGYCPFPLLSNPPFVDHATHTSNIQRQHNPLIPRLLQFSNSPILHCDTFALVSNPVTPKEPRSGLDS